MVCLQSTAALVASSVVIIILLVFHVWCLHALASKLREQGQNLIHQEKLRRYSHSNFTAKIWAPPVKFHTVNMTKSAIQESSGMQINLTVNFNLEI